MNILIVGIASAIIAILAYIINAKVRGEVIETIEMLKMGALGLALGISNIFILNHLSGSTGSLGSSAPEFLTGNPDF